MWIVEWSDRVPLDWISHGDEWVSHLQRLLRRTTNAAFHMETNPADDLAPYPRVELDPRAPDLRGTVWLIPLRGSFLLQLVADEEVDEGELNTWNAAIQGASDAVGVAHEAFKWAAVIGSIPSVGRSPQTLETAFEVGSLSVAPAGVDLVDAGPQANPSLSGWSPRHTRPLVVTGVSRGHEWPAAHITASRLTKRLCALLSLTWDDEWVVRDDAQPDREMSIPSVPAWLRGASWLTDVSQPADTGDVVEPPTWLAQAWEAVSNDAILEDALLVHAEGVSLHHAHPSFALTAFVASIEAIGAVVLDKPKRCPSCNQIRGSTQRFKKALARVVDEATATKLGNVYGQRSSTVHHGRLHGSECVGGVLSMPGFFEMLGGVSPDAFRWQTVRELRSASRESLIGALSGVSTD